LVKLKTNAFFLIRFTTNKKNIQRKRKFGFTKTKQTKLKKVELGNNKLLVMVNAVA
jgi:hypothetical protein